MSRYKRAKGSSVDGEEAGTEDWAQGNFCNEGTKGDLSDWDIE